MFQRSRGSGAEGTAHGTLDFSVKGQSKRFWLSGPGSPCQGH